jgi:hypothetical protein
MTNTFIMTKRTRVGETWVRKYLKSIAVDIRRDCQFGISTCDRNEAMVFNNDKQIEHLQDGVWSKEPIVVS